MMSSVNDEDDIDTSVNYNDGVIDFHMAWRLIVSDEKVTW